MNEREFAKQNFIERGFISCDQVSSYGCIADVLSLDLNKKRIIEYEFKNNSNDLKIAEKKKSKYQIQKRKFRGEYKMLTRKDGTKKWGLNVLKKPQRPHQFYFVIPKKLYEKEKKYLHGLDSFTGVMSQMCDGGKYYVMKRSAIRKNNLQKFDVVLKHMVKRLSSVYTWG